MWEEALGFARTFEIWIYLVLGLGGIIYLRKFALAWQELQGSAFGLEREGAQLRLNTAASALVLLLTMAVVEFILVSFIAPAFPGAMPLPTPTLNLLASPTVALPAGAIAAPETPGAVTPSPELPTLLEVTSGGCVPGQVAITMPKDGEEVSGITPIVGSATIPDFGFYKFEIKRPEESTWLTIQAGNTPQIDNKLGDWDTTRLAPGEYQLALVVVDNEARASAPCVVLVRVARPLDATPGP
jgi:hypothetical protein